MFRDYTCKTYFLPISLMFSELRSALSSYRDKAPVFFFVIKLLLCVPFLFVGTFTQVMRIWGSKNGPWLQAMYACFFIGCLISPLLAKPFLVANEKETVRECYGTMESTALHSIINSSRYPVYNVHDNGDRSLAPSQDNLTDMLLSNTRTDFLNSTTQSWQVVKNANSSLNESPKSVETEIWKAYVIAGIILCCATLSHIAIFVAARHRKALHMYSAPPGTGRPDGGAGGRVLVWLLIVQMAAFFFLFCCMQRGVSSYLFAYAVHCHAWQKGPAAFLKMAYQAGSLGGRLMSIIILHHVTPQTLLMTCCIGSVAALSGLTLAGGYVPVLWISTLVAGICVAPTYACGLSWGSQHFTVGGKVGAIFTLSGATSDILGSLVINLLYDQFGLATYSYFSLILTISMTVIALSMFITIRFINSKIPNRLKTITSIPESATVETDLGKESDFH